LLFNATVDNILSTSLLWNFD